MKLPENAGDGWVIFDGSNFPNPDAIVEVVTQRECDAACWESYPDPVTKWDWSIEGVPGDIVAYRVVEQ